MKRASKYFSENDRKRIEAAVQKAESKTSGEIVPVVATQSGRYDRAEDMFGFFLALGGLAVAWYFFQQSVPVSGDWAQGTTLVLDLPIVLGILVGGYLFGIILATWMPVLRLPFISKKEMDEEVERAAAEAFQKFRLRRTRNASGVLIYISLYERTVRVLGDDAIAQRVKQEHWDNICQTVIEGIRKNQAADGLDKAIQKCGILLGKLFPVKPGDKDELSNELRFID